VGHQEQKEQSEHTETMGKEGTYSTYNKDIVQMETYDIDISNHHVYDKKTKKDWLIKVMNHKELPVFNRVQKLLKGRNILDLKEKEIDGIFGILKIEMERGE